TAMQHGNRVYAATFDQNGKLAATGSWDRTVRIWDVATGRQVGSDLKHEGRVSSLTLSPDGQKLLTGSIEDYKARVWDLTTGELVGPAMLNEGSVLAVAFRPDGKAVATSSGSRVRVWDLTTRKAVVLLHGDTVYAVAFSPDGLRVL